MIVGTLDQGVLGMRLFSGDQFGVLWTISNFLRYTGRIYSCTRNSQEK